MAGRWPTTGDPEHAVQAATRSAVARIFGVPVGALVTATDQCGIQTYAFSLAALARAYTLLADPAAIGAKDPRYPLALHLATVRDAMLAHPELVAGTRDRLDTALMRASPGRLVVKGGAEGLRAIAVVPDQVGGAVSAFAIKVEDGDGYARAGWAIAVEALRSAGLLDEVAVRGLGRYHRPAMVDPRGEVSARTVASFELAPVGELVPGAARGR